MTVHKTIYKYVIAEHPYELRRHMRVPTHGDARVIHAGLQCGNYCIWAEVDPASVLSSTNIYVRGTGMRLTGEETWFLGTVVDRRVFHFYTD